MADKLEDLRKVKGQANKALEKGKHREEDESACKAPRVVGERTT